MAYCGYADILIVVILISTIFLLIFVILLISIFLINQSVLLLRFKIFNVGFFGDLEILFNVWSFLFLIIVVIISRCVMMFSFSYIRGLCVRNFIFLYLSFVIRIIWLILNNNFYWIIFGWDGLGVVSFMLIVFYINNERINNGLFTLFQNRVGDLFFVLFILGIIDLVMWNNIVIKWGLLFIIIGRCVKRAQFPFDAWLLSAMRAPTPISALVHSSTLVVAGVYILLQFRYCLIDVLEVLKYIRVISLILRRIGLLNENDMKKLIAYSTINHVSLIIYLLRFKLYKVVYFHLNVHAIFKSLIFMCFGFVILSSFHAQDKRLVSLLNLNPIIKIIYYFSCICLAGLPFLRAFFSKDFIIEKFIEFSLEFSFIILLMLFLGVSIYYRIKLLNLTNVIYSYSIVEKNYLGLFGLLVIRIVIIGFINVFITLVFRLSLEFMSFKIRIYMFVIFFLLLRICTNLNYKFNVYNKIKNFVEIWCVDFYILDKFVYWNIFLMLNYISVLSNIKLFLLINWWVLLLVVVIF